MFTQHKHPVNIICCVWKNHLCYFAHFAFNKICTLSVHTPRPAMNNSCYYKPNMATIYPHMWCSHCMSMFSQCPQPTHDVNVDVTCQCVNDYCIRRLPTATVHTSSDEYCWVCCPIICSRAVMGHLNVAWPSLESQCSSCFVDILSLFLALLNITQHFTVWCRYVR